MLSIDEIRKILNRTDLTDKQVENIRNATYQMVNKLLDEFYEKPQLSDGKSKMKFFIDANGKKFVRFTKKELQELHKRSKQEEMSLAMRKTNITADSLRKDTSQMIRIAEEAGEKAAQHRDEHEIVASLYIFPSFFGEETQIQYELIETFDPDKDKILCLEDLYKYRKSDSISDFLLISKDGARDFQLKRYRGPFDAQSLFEFIDKKIEHYTNDLDKTNLLIILQPTGEELPHIEIDYEELTKLIKSKDYQFTGNILIAYNSANKKQVIITVHPSLGKSEVPIQKPSEQDFN